MKLICMTFDGDYVTEADGFKTVRDAWEHAEDMGSRWYFYPFSFVTTESGKTIVAAPDLLERFEGRRLKTVRREFASVAALPEAQNADAEEFAIMVKWGADQLKQNLDFLK